MERIERSITASLTEWEPLGKCIRAFCASQGVAGAEAGRILLACEEWVVNIIRHGYGQGTGGLIDVALEVGEGLQPESGVSADSELTGPIRWLTVVIADEAPPFDPLQHPDPDLELPVEQRPLGGLGIWLIRHAVDRLVYERKEGRNVLSMVKAYKSE